MATVLNAGRGLEGKEEMRIERWSAALIKLGLACGCLVFAASAAVADGKWADFKGLYLGMTTNAAKALPLNCSPPTDPRMKANYDEKCIPSTGSDRFSTLGGESVVYLEIAIKGGRVFMISAKTKGQYGGGLEKAMALKYGKPTKSKGDWKSGSFMWDRGGREYITLSMSNGVNELMFAVDNSAVDEAQYKAKRAAAVKDF